MLRKSRIRLVLAAAALTVCVLLVSVVWAAITVDGDCTDANWAGHIEATDPPDTENPQIDGYDIEYV